MNGSPYKLTHDEFEEVADRILIAQGSPKISVFDTSLWNNRKIIAYVVRTPAELRAAVEALQRDALELWQDVPLRSILRTLVLVPEAGEWDGSGGYKAIVKLLRSSLFSFSGAPTVDWIVVDPEWAVEDCTHPIPCECAEMHARGEPGYEAPGDHCEGWIDCRPPQPYSLDAAVIQAVIDVTRGQNPAPIIEERLETTTTIETLGNRPPLIPVAVLGRLAGPLEVPE